MWEEEEPGRESVSAERLAEAKSTGADVIAVACPFCCLIYFLFSNL
jgi:Fe-S oxidoreductase